MPGRWRSCTRKCSTGSSPCGRVCDYVGVGKVLPDSLDELHWHVAQPADEAAQRLALESLVEACVIAASVAKDLNYMDLSSPGGPQGKGRG